MRNLSLLFGTTLALSSLAGCGSSVETCSNGTCSTGSGGSDTTSSSSTSSTSSNGTGGASTSSTGAGAGTPCGGFSGTECTASEYCDYGTNSCGFTDEIGKCKPRPGACDDVYMATCACDGKVYSNPCEANGAGVDANDQGGCMAPMGQFPCGATFCQLGTSYCRRSMSDVGGEPSSYICETLPPACGNPATCACLAKVACGASCEASADGGFTVTCLGG